MPFASRILSRISREGVSHLLNDKESCKTQSTTENLEIVNLPDDRPARVPGPDSYPRASPAARAKLEQLAARGMRAEDMFGFLADAIDYEFLEIVLGCRGRKVPKDIGL
jgi:hypothetical protein